MLAMPPTTTTTWPHACSPFFALRAAGLDLESEKKREKEGAFEGK
jgi:hypothetical protein